MDQLDYTGKAITVQKLFDDLENDLELKLQNPEVPLTRRVMNPAVQKYSLVLTGYTKNLHPERIQLFGETEISFMETLSERKLRQNFKIFLENQIPCLIISRNLNLPEQLFDMATIYETPVIRTPKRSSTVFRRIAFYLDEILAPDTSVHGTLMDVHGVGVLIIGQAGIGKSESALNLILRGHRFIVDDHVVIRKRADDAVVGYSSEILKHFMEVRGIGIIDIRNLLGVAAIRHQKKLQLVIELIKWDPKGDFERLGLEEHYYEILGVRLPFVQIPAAPGRHIAVSIEVAARNQLLKMMGVHSGQVFDSHLTNMLHKESVKTKLEEEP